MPFSNIAILSLKIVLYPLQVMYFLMIIQFNQLAATAQWNIYSSALVPLATAPTVTQATQNYITPRKQAIKVFQVLSGW